MKATRTFGAGVIRVVDVPDATITSPTDAVVRVVRVRVHVRIGPSPLPQ